jgi:hypothetical protein
MNRDISANRSFNRRDAPSAKESHRQSGILKEGRRLIYKVDVQTGDAVLIAEMDRGLRLRDGPVWAKDGKSFFYTAGLRSEENMGPLPQRQPGRPVHRVPIPGHGPHAERSLGHGELPARGQGEKVGATGKNEALISSP